MKERILRFIAYLGIPVYQFEQKAGLSNGYVKNIKEGVGLMKLETILKAYPELNRVWLMTGEGEMLNPPAVATNASGNATAIGNGNGNVNHVNTADVIAILHEQLRVKDEQIKAQQENITALVGLLSK